MADLEYSSEALNARNEFLGIKTVIYVEGDDDVLFWTEIFSEVADDKFEVEPMGGSMQLDNRIKEIESGKIKAIAARDSDFLKILQKSTKHPRVLYTHSYSIENSLYVTDSILELTKSFCKNNKVQKSECEEWLTTLAKNIAPLVHIDIANEHSLSGQPTIGDNCARFMQGNTVCSSKVSNFVDEASKKIPLDSIKIYKNKIGADCLPVINNIRGHFLATAVHKYIVQRAKEFGKKVSISYESLYSSAITCFKNLLSRNSHPHKDYYISAATKAWKSL